MSPNPNPTSIYVLRDPRDGSVRYIGKTTLALEQRLFNHISDAFSHTRARKTHKSKWIRKLDRLNLHPAIALLRTVDRGEDVNEIERLCIAHYKRKGCRLVNGTLGGDGGMTGVARENHLRAIRHPNHLAAMALETRARWQDPVYREKQRLRHCEYWADPAAHAKQSTAAQKMWQSPATRENLLAGLRDPVKRAKHAEWLKANKAEHAAAISAGHRKRWDETPRHRMRRLEGNAHA